MTFCCREVFHVIEDTLCVPKLTCVLPTCTLRVINNDTQEEVPRVFLRVAPHLYKKNSVRLLLLYHNYSCQYVI